MERSALIERKTGETDIFAKLTLDGSGKREISTGIGFFDHMLSAFTLHGGFDLRLKAVGDLEVDGHHTVEDTGIVLGSAFRKALGDNLAIVRFGSSSIPMDEALALTTVDISGRPFLVFRDGGLSTRSMPGFDPALVVEFLRAFSVHASITLHTRVEYGDNPHHIIEAVFKSLGRALREAVALSGGETPSTKGAL